MESYYKMQRLRLLAAGAGAILGASSMVSLGVFLAGFRTLALVPLVGVGVALVLMVSVFARLKSAKLELRRELRAMMESELGLEPGSSEQPPPA